MHLFFFFVHLACGGMSEGSWLGSLCWLTHMPPKPSGGQRAGDVCSLVGRAGPWLSCRSGLFKIRTLARVTIIFVRRSLRHGSGKFPVSSRSEGREAGWARGAGWARCELAFAALALRPARWRRLCWLCCAGCAALLGRCRA